MNRKVTFDDASPLVSVIDDDESVREALPDLLREFGFSVEAFSSANEFLASSALWRSACLVLDIQMPGMSGLELHRELVRRQNVVPVVFITAHADQTLCGQVIKAGAIDCLKKPFSETDLLGAVNTALGRR